MTGPDDVPPEAGARLSGGAFTSGLSVPDLSACLRMGLEPVGYVQGTCVVQWSWSGLGGQGILGGMSGVYGAAPPPGAYRQVWNCPHGFVSNEHRRWGSNDEMTWLSEAWEAGFDAARQRLVEEATEAGAHGVVAVVDTARPLGDLGVLEFRLRGTAVRLAGATRPEGRPVWTTALTGQRLAKSVEAGLAPVSVVATLSTVRVWASCVTLLLSEGNQLGWGVPDSGAEIDQLSDALMAVRRLARNRLRDRLGGDDLLGADLETSQRSMGEGDAVLECVLRGSRVRRFKPFDALPAPRATVRLS